MGVVGTGATVTLVTAGPSPPTVNGVATVVVAVVTRRLGCLRGVIFLSMSGIAERSKSGNMMEDGQSARIPSHFRIARSGTGRIGLVLAEHSAVVLSLIHI